MKKIIYLLMITGVLFTSCDPLEDIDNALNAQEDIIVGEAKFTMTDDDYDDLNLSFGNFSSVDDAKALIPDLLVDKFPVWGEGSLAEVTFDLFKSNSIRNPIEYEVTDQDYEDTGFGFGNFSNDADFETFLSFKYPNATRGDLVDLTYQWWAPGLETRTDKIILLDGWQKTTQFSSDDYDAMGQNFPNFSDRDLAEFRIGIYLKTLLPFAEAEDHLTTLYQFWNGSEVIDRIAPYTYDGDKWNIIGSVIEDTIKFGHNGTVWEPDNTIIYTLTSADFALVGNGNFNNFDVREGRGEFEESVRIEKINIILKNNFPNAAQGQKFLVKYAVWTGAPDVFEIKLILEGADYVKFEG